MYYLRRPDCGIYAFDLGANSAPAENCDTIPNLSHLLPKELPHNPPPPPPRSHITESKRISRYEVNWLKFMYVDPDTKDDFILPQLTQTFQPPLFHNIQGEGNSKNKYKKRKWLFQW